MPEDIRMNVPKPKKEKTVEEEKHQQFVIILAGIFLFVAAMGVIIFFLAPKQEMPKAQEGTKVPDMSSLYDASQEASQTVTDDSAQSASEAKASSESETEAAVIVQEQSGEDALTCEQVTEEGSKAKGILALIYKQKLKPETIEFDQLNADYYDSVMEQEGNALGRGIPYEVDVYAETLDTSARTVKADIDGVDFLIHYTVDEKNCINGITAEEL